MHMQVIHTRPRRVCQLRPALSSHTADHQQRPGTVCQPALQALRRLRAALKPPVEKDVGFIEPDHLMTAADRPS